MWCFNKWNWIYTNAKGTLFSLHKSSNQGEKLLKKAIYEKEMLEILHALNQWFPYFIGRHFKVKTDHDSLKYFLEQRLFS